MELTREKVLAMEAGREMDRLVGGLIMGLDLVEDTLPHLPKHYYPGYDRTVFTDVPKYSTDISAAWEVSEKFETIEIQRFITDKGLWFCEIKEKIWHRSYGNTAPLAICRAALLTTLTKQEA